MLLSDIQEDLKQAQLARDEVKVGTLRMLLSEVKYAEIAKTTDLEESDLISVVSKEVKKRKEAAESFRTGNREDLALKEEAESQILEKYLPAQISDTDLETIITQVITEQGASVISDMGKVIGAVKIKVGNSADGGRIAALVKQKLS